jgi:hypothetical protein
MTCAVTRDYIINDSHTLAEHPDFISVLGSIGFSINPIRLLAQHPFVPDFGWRQIRQSNGLVPFPFLRVMDLRRHSDVLVLEWGVVYRRCLLIVQTVVIGQSREWQLQGITSTHWEKVNHCEFMERYRVSENMSAVTECTIV